MAKKETFDKLIKILAESNDKELTFNGFVEKSGFMKNTVSNALKKLIVMGIIQKKKSVNGDKRFSYYSFVNDSDIAIYQLQKLLQKREYTHISKVNLELWIRKSVINILDLNTNEILEILEIEKHNLDDLKIIETSILEYMKLIILDILGIEILYSNNIHETISKMKIKNEEIQNKELHNVHGEKIFDSDQIPPNSDLFQAIIRMIFLGMTIQRELKAFNEEFQFIFGFSPKYEERKRKKDFVRDRVIKTIFKYREFIGEEFSISEILTISKNESELIARVDSILEKVSSKLFELMRKTFKQMKYQPYFKPF